MVLGGNQSYCNSHFSVYTNTELCCTPKANVMLYVNNTSIKQIFNYTKKRAAVGIGKRKELRLIDFFFFFKQGAIGT